MVIVDGPNKSDAILEKDGIKVFLEKEANKLLSNATLDYTAKEGIINGGMPRFSCCG
jgi:Fe-S cluster assembly iron-binding protein IscA